MNFFIWFGFLAVCFGFTHGYEGDCGRCDPNAHCEVDKCVCLEGFKGNGTTCAKEMCSENTSCPADSRCVNETCVKQETMCKHCPQLSSCENVDKDCRCKSGFVLDGTSCLRKQAVAGGNETSTINETITNKDDLEENTNDTVTGKSLQQGSSNSIDNNTRDVQENNKNSTNTDGSNPTLLTRTLDTTGGKNSNDKYNGSSSGINNIFGHTSKPQNINDTVTNPKENISKNDTPVLDQVNGVRTDTTNVMQNTASHNNMDEARQNSFQKGPSQEISSDSINPRSATEKILSDNEKKPNKSSDLKIDSLFKDDAANNKSITIEETSSDVSPTTAPDTTARPYVTKKRRATSSHVTYPTPKLPPFPPVSIELPSYTVHMHPSAYPTTNPGQDPNLPQLKVGPVEIVDENAHTNNPEIPSMLPMNPEAVAVNTHVIDFKGAGGSEVVDRNEAGTVVADGTVHQLPSQTLHSASELPLAPQTSYNGASPIPIQTAQNPINPVAQQSVPMQNPYALPHLPIPQENANLPVQPLVPAQILNSPVQHPLMPQTINSAAQYVAPPENLNTSPQMLAHSQNGYPSPQQPVSTQTVVSSPQYGAPLQNPNTSPPILAHSQNGYSSPQQLVSTQTAVSSPQYGAPLQNTNPSLQLPVSLPNGNPSSQTVNSAVQQPAVSVQHPSRHKPIPKKHEVKKVKERHSLFSNPHPDNPLETILQSVPHRSIDRRTRVRMHYKRKSTTT